MSSACPTDSYCCFVCLLSLPHLLLDNYVYNMQDAGIAILESFDSEIYDNTFSDVKYGIRISLGGGNNDVHDNVFDKCSQCEGCQVNALSLPMTTYSLSTHYSPHISSARPRMSARVQERALPASSHALDLKFLEPLDGTACKQALHSWFSLPLRGR